MSSYILMTGATGLLGEYLLHDLLKLGYRFALVVRRGRKESVQQRIESMLQMWERRLGYLLPRPVCFEGDVSSELLGLDEPDRHWISMNCDRVLHNAAVLTFFGENREGE
ncbi:MAG: SDR family oxidoreductase, partial [Planctomycetales bacterium]